MNNNYNIAVSAINLLSDGLTSENDTKTREALNMISNDFSWEGLEVVKMEWDELLLEMSHTQSQNFLDYKIPLYEIGSYQFYDKKSRDEYLLRKIEMDLDYLKSVVSSSDSEIIDDMINDIKMLKT